MSQSPWDSSKTSRTWHSRLWPHLPAFALYLLLTFWTTYPLWLAPASSLSDIADPQLTAWIFYWARYALFNQVLEFFQANIFWPYSDTLAYGEHLLAPALETMPLWPFSHSAPTLQNVAVMQGFFFSALGAYALGLHYFRGAGARRHFIAMIVGLAYGFAPYRIAHIGHVQLLHGEWLPVIVLAFERLVLILIRDPRPRRARAWQAALAFACLGQWLTGWYWAVFSFWMVTPLIALRFWQHRAQVTPRILAALLIPFVVAGVVALPMALPYVRLKVEYILVRPADSGEAFTAQIIDFLRPSGRHLFYGWLDRLAGYPGHSVERQLFPGLVATATFVWGVACCLTRRAGEARQRIGRQAGDIPANPEGHQFPSLFWLVLTLILISFCFGSHFDYQIQGRAHSIPLPYALVGGWLPFAETMRAPARWMLPALLGWALVIGHGVHRAMFIASARGRMAGAAITIALPLLLAADCLTRPLSPARVPTSPPAVAAWFNRQTYPAPYVLIPTDHPHLMLWATWIRQPMINGWNGFAPPYYTTIMRDVNRFPQEVAWQRLRYLRARYILVDVARTPYGMDHWQKALQAHLAENPGSFSHAPLGDCILIDLGDQFENVPQDDDTPYWIRNE